MMPYRPSEIIFNLRKVGQIIHNRRKIKQVVLNGVIIWPAPDFKYLELEKERVYLEERNNYEDTNEVYTNSTFSVS